MDLLRCHQQSGSIIKEKHMFYLSHHAKILCSATASVILCISVTSPAITFRLVSLFHTDSSHIHTSRVHTHQLHNIWTFAEGHPQADMGVEQQQQIKAASAAAVPLGRESEREGEGVRVYVRKRERRRKKY